MNIRLYDPVRDGAQARYIIMSAVRLGCRVDHLGDGPTVNAWLEAAFPYLDAPGATVIVMDRGMGYLDGVAALDLPSGAPHTAILTLNYVLPEAFRMGVAAAMLDRLEAHARSKGAKSMTLESTMAARGFYFKRGYREHKQPRRGNGVSWNFPMMKELT